MAKELTRSGQKELLPAEKGGYSNSGIKYSARCGVCSAPEEILIAVNRMLVSGARYKEIADTQATFMRMVGLNPFNVHTVKNHHQNHFNFQSEALRKIIQKRQQQLAGTWKEGVDDTIDAMATAEVVMRKGLNHILNEETVPSVGDTLNAAKLVHELSKDSDGREQLQQANAAMAKIIRAVKAVCTDDQMQRILAIINSEEQVEHVIHVDDEDSFYDDEDSEVDLSGAE